MTFLIAAGSLLLSAACHADLVAHYAFDETDTTAAPAADSLGANPGTVSGGAANVTKGVASPKAYLGTAYDFTTNGGLNIGGNPTTRPVDQWTMTWWMRPDTLDAFDRIYETMSGTTPSGNGIRIDLGSSPGNRLRVLLRDGNGSTQTTHSHSQVLSTGTWYFCAVRYDSQLGSGAALKMTVIPAGGSSITGAGVTAATQSPGSLGTGPLFIHAQGASIAADDAGAAGGNDFGGALDDFAIFQTGDQFGVLSDAQIAEVHNIGALAFDPPPSPPVIQTFTATPSAVASGANVTLDWDVDDATSVEITPGVGTVATTGSTTINPTASAIYTLTANNAEGSSTEMVGIIVDGLPIPPYISELVSANGGTLLDGDGNSPDWIEVHNPNLTTLDISGYFLTDDPATLNKWPFPAGTVLNPLEYFVVFASGQPTSTYIDAGGNLHTNFALSSNGEYLALVSPDGSTIVHEFSPEFPEIPQDASYGPSGFHPVPSPRLPDVTGGFSGFVEDTKFTVDRGFFSAPFNLDITTDTPGAEVYYTTDGSAPSPTNGTMVSGPITINATTVLRAAAFKTGFAPTNIDTQTYLFLADVLTQSNTQPGLPVEWANHPADYEMDPDVVSNPAYSADMIPALQEFPTLSVAIDPDDFFGEANGLYQFPQSSGDAWERPVSAELMVHDGSEAGFQIDAGLRIQGGSSRNPDTPKHSMSLRFRNQYGAGKLRYDVFKDAPFGRGAVDEFDFLQLRSGYNFGWVHRHYYQSRHAQYNRDQFANDLYLAMGNTGIHGRWVHLYINGLYWGIYHMHERPDADYMSAYYGGEPDDYDAINSGAATNGTNTAYRAMADFANNNNMADPALYATMQTHLDVESFIDYMLMNIYIGNLDWDGHNWRAAGQGPGGEPFRFFPWDSEISVAPNGSGVIPSPQPLSAALNKDVTNKNGTRRPTGVHQDLRSNLEYRIGFADHAQRHMFHGGPLSPEGATSIWRRRSDTMDNAVVAESARWGDFRRDVEAGSAWNSTDYDLYTKNDHYLPDQAWLVGTYLQQRRDIVLAQLRTDNLYPATDPPEFAQHGGTAPAGFALGMSNPNGSGTIYYRLDGGDPREPGGAVAAGAQTYSTDVPLPGTLTVNARVLDGGDWSALQSAQFIVGTPAGPSNLVVSELLYNPPGGDESGEFIELTNISATDTIEMTDVEFSEGIFYTFPAGLQLAPGGRIVLSPADYTGNLDNNGETVTLRDHSGAEIDSFTYDDRSPWPEAPDGDGYSLVRVAPELDLDPDLPSSWRSSTEAGGNPGTSDAVAYAGGDLLEYALGPEKAYFLGINGAGDIASLEYSRNLAADDVTYTVWVSTDLVTWNTGPGFTAVTNERIPRPDGTTDITVSSLLPADTNPRQFMKLVVETR